MKKINFVLLAIVMVMGLAFTGVLQSVNANQQTNDNNGPTPTPTVTQVVGIADGDWSGGSDVSYDLTEIKSPKSYFKLLDDPIKADTKGVICHPFHGGQYGWIGRIYMLDNGKWIPVNTFFAWVPDEEGEFMACVNAKAGGIYALFGNFDNSTNPTATLKPSATPTLTPTPTRTPTPKPTSKPPSGDGSPTQMNRA
jgi:hypothetical protein